MSRPLNDTTRIRQILEHMATYFGGYAHFFYHRIFPFFSAVLVLFIVYSLSQLNEDRFRDRLIQDRAEPVHQSHVTLVLIDDESEAMLNRRSRQSGMADLRYSDLLTRINQHQPAVMVQDIAFSEDDATPMAEFKNLIVGYAPQAVSRAQGSSHALKHGVMGITPDDDGTVRSLPTLYDVPWKGSDVSGQRSEHRELGISLETARTFLGQRSRTINPALSDWQVHANILNGAPSIRVTPNGHGDQGLIFPTDSTFRLPLHWYAMLPASNSQATALSHYSIAACRFYDACEGAQAGLTATDRQRVRDHIVILGATSLKHNDFYRTPMSPRHPGADILATGIDNILKMDMLLTVPPWLNALLLIAFVLPTFYLRLKLRGLGPTFLYTAALMVFFFWLAMHQLKNGVILDIVTPEVFMVVAFAAGTFFKEFAKDKTLDKLEKNLSKLVSHEVFAEIQKMEGGLQAGGQRMEITAVFVDLRNFTPLAERLSPVILKDILNAFYTVVEDVTLQHRGMIDKFLGDGVLIIFGAPWPSERHAESALAASTEIIEAVQQLIVTWEETFNLRDDHTHVTLDVGVAMNSGSAFVGFLGTPERVTYTAVGDVVNLASRLEEMNKTYRSRLILSAYSADRIADAETRLQRLDTVQIRGREAAIDIFTLAEHASDQEVKTPETIDIQMIVTRPDVSTANTPRPSI